MTHAALTTPVTTFDALEAAITDGADIVIAADIKFTDTITIASDVGVSMSSTNGAVLDGGGKQQFMHIEGALTASGITFQVGS